MEENRKDPAFKLLVILMQPKETLQRFTPCMDKLFRTQTYLLKDDPQLENKIINHLRQIRGNGDNIGQ